MFNELERKSDVIKNFAPSWFASVMGTGILALTTYFYSEFIPFFNIAGKALFYFNIFLFVILFVPWLLRWLIFPENAKADLIHPVLSNFYPTIAVGFLVLSADFLIIGNNFIIGEILWYIGTVSTILFAVLIPFNVFTGSHVKIDHINPAWFIPPVALIVIPIPGSILICKSSGILKEALILVNYFGWGAGFFLYLSLLSITMYRFALHHPLPNIMAPTIWINLGPIGAGTVAIIKLVGACNFVTSKDAFYTFGLIFWGFGIWWVIMAIFLTLHYIKKLKLPYAMSWWAFTFPLGAYVSGNHAIATIFKMKILDLTGFVLYWLLLFLWGITLIKTIIAVWKGGAFKSN